MTSAAPERSALPLPPNDGKDMPNPLPVTTIYMVTDTACLKLTMVKPIHTFKAR